jgi:hypothetical protein
LAIRRRIIAEDSDVTVRKTVKGLGTESLPNFCRLARIKCSWNYARLHSGGACAQAQPETWGRRVTCLLGRGGRGAQGLARCSEAGFANRQSLALSRIDWRDRRDSDRWKQVDNLLLAALEQPAAERAEFLSQVWAGDQALEREVRLCRRYGRKRESSWRVRR